MSPVRVLVADDEPIIRSALEELISGHPELEFVGAAADAQEAIDRAIECGPDVVLLDVRMPHGGGPRAAAAIDALPAGPRTVAFSAYDDRTAIMSMLDAGACGYLVKGAPNGDIVTTLLGAAQRGNGLQTRPPTLEAALRVLVADEPGKGRRALIALVEAEIGFELVAVAANAAEALSLACIHRPGAVLVGRTLPGGSTAAISEIRQAVPDTSILAYTVDAEPRGVRDALEAGAMSYVVTDERDEEIIGALREAGRGRSRLSPAATDAVVQELRLAAGSPRERRSRSRRRDELERFLGGNGLEVALQPIFTLESRAPVAVEALARFDRGAAGTPNVWFAAAAAEGLGVELELASVRAALATLEDLPSDFNLALNVSPSVAASDGLLELLADAPARRLILELTEHAAVQDYAALSAALHDLRSRGLKVAVDDAGAGFASLRHVLLLEPDYLKLDISLCAGIASDRRRRALARALLTFAREIGMATIAEGVESEADLAALSELGADFAQGFHLAPPGSLAWLLRREGRPAA